MKRRRCHAAPSLLMKKRKEKRTTVLNHTPSPSPSPSLQPATLLLPAAAPSGPPYPGYPPMHSRLLHTLPQTIYHLLNQHPNPLATALSVLASAVGLHQYDFSRSRLLKRLLLLQINVLLPCALAQSVVLRPAATRFLTSLCVAPSALCLLLFAGKVRVRREHDVPLTEVGTFDDDEVRFRLGLLTFVCVEGVGCGLTRC